MAPKPQKDDLIIGENRWITFVQHDWRNVNRVDVDDILDPLFPLFDRLESDCIAECCGLEAFCFLPEKIAAASSDLDLNEVREWLSIAIGEIARMTSWFPVA